MADFAELKSRITIEQVVQQLGLQMRANNTQMRGVCPACETGGDRALVVTPSKALFYCFSAGIGGDMIALWGHIKQCSLADAGKQIAQAFPARGTSAPAPPIESASAPAAQGFKALDYLDPEHEAVIAAGFDTEEAKVLGIGYAPKGVLRGTVAVPIRLPDGTLVGYIGVQEAKLPPRGLLGGNVVPFGKKSA